MSAPASFDCYGAACPVTPVILSVPHAGRDYPASLLTASRLHRDALVVLEDRRIDDIARAARRFETLLVARRPRAWIDLNRAENERDPAIDDGADAIGRRDPSLKLRSGLGLVPRRASGHGDIWRRRFSDAEISERIATDHRPYHETLARLLRQTRERFGTAVLLDIHSMPPLGTGPGAPGVVLGDRFGTSAATRMMTAAEAAIGRSGYRIAINAPYSGGHILDRHGDPGQHIHAIQIEIDRSAYLDARMLAPGPGAERVSAMLRAVIEALAEAVAPGVLAAE